MEIKLLIAYQDEKLALALSKQFAQEGASIAADTTGLAKLLAKVAADRPDVLLLEHSLCGEDAHQILLTLRTLSPATRILVVCEACTHDLMLAFIKLGASGCVLALDPPSVLAKAVRAVHGGDTWFEQSTLLQALHSLIDTARAEGTPVDEGRLTQREGEILDLAGRGLSNKEIARELGISDLTVKTHLHRIYVKLQQSGRHKALLSHPNRLAY